MSSVEVTASTREDAIQTALKKLGAERHEVKVEILDEGSKGVFGIGARDVRVRVTTEDKASDRGPEAAALLETVIERMGIEAEVACHSLEDGNIQLQIVSPDSAILIGRRGQNLNALQYLMNRMAQSEEGAEIRERIIVDCERYLERRRASLEEMARRLAQKVKDTGRRVRVKPLDAHERRIIHVTLQDDPAVCTFSVGNSQERTVVIAPKEETEPEGRRPRRSGAGSPRRGGRMGRPPSSVEGTR